MVPALFIANYIIEYSNQNGYEINNLKLQKLLYFISARALVEDKPPLFNESIEKWRFGPVVPEVYHKYKEFGAFSIQDNNIIRTLFRFDFNKNPFEDDSSVQILEYDSQEIPEKELIEDTVSKLSNRGAFELVDITHKQPMWQRDEKRILMGEKGIKYNLSEVREYFLQKTSERIWSVGV